MSTTDRFSIEEWADSSRGSKPTGVFEQLSQTVAELLFDSWAVAGPAGIRNSAKGPRRLVFMSGDLLIDMQFSKFVGSHRKVLIGQIAAKRSGVQRLDAMHVLLHTPRQSVAKAAVNGLGEFQMEFEHNDDDLTLAFVLYNGVTLIPLGTLS